MKKLTAVFTALLLLTMTLPVMAASAVNKDGYYKGIKLCGRVKIVEHFADIKGEPHPHLKKWGLQQDPTPSLG